MPPDVQSVLASRDLHTESVALAKRLIESEEPSARWIGRDALKELTGPVVTRKLAAR